MSEQPPPQPQWSPPPPPQAGWGMGGQMPPQRPMGVTLGSIYLIVMGVLFSLGGAACAIGGGAIGGLDIPELPGVGGAIGGALLVGGIIVLVLGILQIAAGAGALGGKGWGRLLGIILAALFGLGALFSGVTAVSVDAGSAVVPLVIGALYALTAFVLIQAGPYFAFRR